MPGMPMMLQKTWAVSGGMSEDMQRKRKDECTPKRVV
jgi:hypothetical protein